MSFDQLAQFDTSGANAGAKMEIRDPNGVPMFKADGSPLTITLLGRDSDAFIKAENQQTNRRLSQGTRVKLTAEALRADSIAVLARCTTAWDLDEPCSYETAVALYTKFPAIREQADEFLTDRSNFTKASPAT